MVRRMTTLSLPRNHGTQTSAKGVRVKSLLKELVRGAIPVRWREPLFQILLSAIGEDPKGRPRLHNQMANMEWSLKNLRQRGFSADTVIDIGAYEGHWTRMILPIFSESRVHMVEAQPSKEEFLKGVREEFPERVDYSIALLGTEDKGSAPFYVTEGRDGGSTGSSVLEEQSNVPRRIVMLPMTTLDQVVEKKALNGISFLKLDVQGYELEVLRGAENTVSEVEGVLIEVSLMATNRSAPLFGEVVRFMESKGFLVYDICSFFRRPSDGRLYQMDVIFMRSDSPLAKGSELVF
jgi:FkbM family methyltransferase